MPNPPLLPSRAQETPANFWVVPEPEDYRQKIGGSPVAPKGPLLPAWEQEMPANVFYWRVDFC